MILRPPEKGGLKYTSKFFFTPTFLDYIRDPSYKKEEPRYLFYLLSYPSLFFLLQAIDSQPRYKHEEIA